jgi:hypothetical protein
VKAYGEMDIKLHTLSISALDGRDLWAPSFGKFYQKVCNVINIRYEVCVATRPEWKP